MTRWVCVHCVTRSEYLHPFKWEHTCHRFVLSQRFTCRLIRLTSVTPIKVFAIAIRRHKVVENEVKDPVRALEYQIFETPALKNFSNDLSIFFPFGLWPKYGLVLTSVLRRIFKAILFFYP